MSDMEIKNVISPACDDAEYVREVTEAKRALELWTMEPDFQEKFLARHMVFGMGHVVLVEGHLIDQEHRLAVREVLFDFFSIH